MRLQKYIIVLLCSLFVACSTNTSPVVPADKMKDILTDMHYADIYSTMVRDSLNMGSGKNKDSLALYYKSILQHHNVSAEDFDKSIKWYKLNPEQLDSIYAAIIPQISKMESMYPNK